jgi:putative chitobiose transport system substrate-binding protein
MATRVPLGRTEEHLTSHLDFWAISLQPFFTDFVNGLIASYERANPGVKICWVDVQFGAVEQKLLAALAGGVAPERR